MLRRIDDLREIVIVHVGAEITRLYIGLKHYGTDKSFSNP